MSSDSYIPDGSDIASSTTNIEKLRKQREPGNVNAILLNQQKETFLKHLATLKGPLCERCHRTNLEPYLIGPDIKSKKWIVGLWYWQCPRGCCRLEEPIEGQIHAEEDDELIPEDMTAAEGNDNHTFILSTPTNRRNSSRRKATGSVNDNLDQEDLAYLRNMYPGSL